MSVLRCGSCSAPAQSDSAATCLACGGLLEVDVAPPAFSGTELRAIFAARVARQDNPADRSGVWRYRDLVLRDAEAHVVTYPEGNTPLLDHTPIARWSGVSSLMLKHEGMNPTGSFKDRGMAVALTQARQIGASAVLSASTGNTSSSMAAYAALARLPAVVLVPAGQVAPAKLAQTIAYGARVVSVNGDFDTCLRLARESVNELGMYLVNSVNPYRLQGQKTIVFEMLQQLAWAAPDWIALPAGNLGNASAFGQALRDARAFGLIASTPRLLLVQAAGAAPFADSFQHDFAVRSRVTPTTIASAIRIGDPASFDRAVRAVRETDGVVTAVSDDEILEAKRIIDRAGIGCEPASAASVAGVRQLVARGVVGRGASVVAVLTGHILKDVTGGLPPRAEAPIEPDLRALASVLRSAP